MDYTVPGILQARILEGIAFPFSRGSSQPVQVSCVAGRFFASWATREAQVALWHHELTAGFEVRILDVGKLLDGST